MADTSNKTSKNDIFGEFSIWQKFFGEITFCHFFHIYPNYNGNFKFKNISQNIFFKNLYMNVFNVGDSGGKFYNIDKKNSLRNVSSSKLNSLKRKI